MGAHVFHTKTNTRCNRFFVPAFLPQLSLVLLRSHSSTTLYFSCGKVNDGQTIKVSLFIPIKVLEIVSSPTTQTTVAFFIPPESGFFFPEFLNERATTKITIICSWKRISCSTFPI